MRLKPSLDVENIDDFNKYYRRAYIKDRNGIVWFIREVGSGKKGQVLVNRVNEDPAEGLGEMRLVSWEDVPTQFVFGKYYPGMVAIDGGLAYVTDTRGRDPGRGFSFDTQNVSWIRHCDNNPEHWMPWFARVAMNVDYLDKTPLSARITKAGDSGSFIINRLMGGYILRGNCYLFVRSTNIGVMNVVSKAIEYSHPYYEALYGSILARLLPNKKD